jgi:uncharacterized LabA/DUF88 family protein
MAEQCYLFIDGAYLRQRHSEMISRVFNTPADLDLLYLRQAVSGQTPEGRPSQFQRVFYYDCLHDVARVDETPEQLEARIREQNAFFQRVQTNHGFHVRLGSLSGTSKKLRQKEVDILLAVEMLDNAFRKNMTSAALIAGDLDFAPLVDSLVRLGTWVDIYHDPKSIAPGPLASADRGIPLTFHNYYLLSSADFQKANPVPRWTGNPTWRPEGVGYSLLRSGRLPGGDSVRLYQHDAEYFLFVYDQAQTKSLISHSDPAVLENYFAVTQSAVEWEADTATPPTRP